MDSKNKLEDFFMWATRGLLAIIFTMLANMMYRFDNLEAMASDVKVLNAKVNILELQTERLRNEYSDLFRNYDLKPKK